jgi:tetratricopeptide (TPR) repeat protein
MNGSTSRLLRHLDAAIASATDPLLADTFRAERACYLARQGGLVEAQSTVIALRARYDADPNLVMTIWINLAEGMVSHFSDMGTLARDKIHRAYALSEASQDPELVALTAAWLAHMDYLNVAFAQMAKHVSRSLQNATENSHSAQSRLSLVVADAYHLAGRLDLAQPWYSRARIHAVAEGDDATISALMHNMAWLRAANLRQAELRSLPRSPSGEHALMSAEAISQFDELVGANSLSSLIPILRAQVLSIQGDFAQALVLYEEHFASAMRQGMLRMKGSLLADQAWCRLQLGQVAHARRDAVDAESSIDPRGQFDDCATAHSRLAQIFRVLDEGESAERHATLANQSWDSHVRMQASIMESLATIQQPGAARTVV